MLEKRWERAEAGEEGERHKHQEKEKEEGSKIYNNKNIEKELPSFSLRFRLLEFCAKNGQKTGKKNSRLMHRPGIEPGSPAWQASILPLNHRC